MTTTIRCLNCDHEEAMPGSNGLVLRPGCPECAPKPEKPVEERIAYTLALPTDGEDPHAVILEYEGKLREAMTELRKLRGQLAETAEVLESVVNCCGCGGDRTIRCLSALTKESGVG